MDGDTDSWCAQPRPMPVLELLSEGLWMQVPMTLR